MSRALGIAVAACLAIAPWVVAATPPSLAAGCSGHVCENDVIEVGDDGLEVLSIDFSAHPLILSFYDAHDGRLVTSGYFDLRYLSDPLWSDDLTALAGRTVIIRGFFPNPPSDNLPEQWSAQFAGARASDSQAADEWRQHAAPVFADSHHCTSNFCAAGISALAIQGGAAFFEVASLSDDGASGFGASCAYLAHQAPCPRPPTMASVGETVAKAGRLALAGATDTYCVSVSSVGDGYLAGAVVPPTLVRADQEPVNGPIASCVVPEP